MAMSRVGFAAGGQERQHWIPASAGMTAGHFLTQRSEHRIALRLGRRRDLAIEAPAMAVHPDQEWAEAPHPELPETLGIEIVEIHVLDRLDPRRLERRRPADDGEIHAPEVAERRERCFAQPPLADDHAHPVLAHQRPRESLHARARRRTDAQRRIAGRMVGRCRHLLHVRRGVDHRVSGEIEARLPAAVEHVDLRGIADAEERAVQGDGVAGAEPADLAFSDRCGQVVVGHAAVW